MDHHINFCPWAIREIIISLGRNTRILTILCQLIIDLHFSYIFCKWFNPTLIIQKQFKRQTIILEYNRIHMGEMMPWKVNCYLAISKIEWLKITPDYFFVCFNTLGLQYEFRIPFSDILINNKHLKESIRGFIIKGPLS